ncbi:hypothetical protein COV20_01960 [Candidatus Woesearchaeota archaeon CG10_big_fil_rev_8_21_14_0_10_45_16]|nr:MAG: hypothetical protein COV20_01960 [Candidatus Woesearchaeota archaeon CG10_big_fil_rev_8_21_14_0_10_45_16]
MKKKSWVLLLLLFVSGGLLVFHLPGQNLTSGAVAETRAYECSDCNVIFILIDTLRADHLPMYGYQRNTAPNLQALADNGIVFRNALAQSSWTKPATATYFTGLYPKNHQADTNERKLTEEKLLLPEILQDNGFNTHAFIANPAVGTTAGFNQGYDTFIEKTYPDDYSDTLNGEIIPFIESLNKTSKQFIYLHYMDPHYPYEPREKNFFSYNDSVEKFINDVFASGFSLNASGFEETYEKKTEIARVMMGLYDDEILYNDKMIGNVLAALKRKGMYENSIIIVVSDHGEEFMDHGSFHHGETLFNEMLKVPWIMRLPNKVHLEVDKMVGEIDLIPTLLPLLDINPPEGIDGINVLSKEKHDSSFAELNLRGHIFSSVQTPEDKLITGVIDKPDVKTLLPYTWFEKETEITFKGTSVNIPIMSFYKNQDISIYRDGRMILNRIVPPFSGGGFTLNFEDEEEKTLKIVSDTPCTKVSKISGREEDQRCLSFGLIRSPYPELDKGLQPFYGYFRLQSDPQELENHYVDPSMQDRVNAMEKEIDRYNEKKVSENKEEVEYTEEQLRALKALGYLN